LELEENLAVVAEAVIRNRKLPWEYIFYLEQLGQMAKAIPYPLFHQYYMRDPMVLRDIFPGLRPESTRHIPLAVSWTTTSCVTPGIDFLDTITRYRQMRSLLREDQQVAEFGPEYARGLSKLLRRREEERSAEYGAEHTDWDIGSMDRV
jgi:hypothetical protein